MTMKTLPILLSITVCLGAGGCRFAQQQRQHATALERHNRMLEDEIYRLRWALEDCQHALERAQETGGGGDTGRVDSESAPSTFALPRADDGGFFGDDRQQRDTGPSSEPEPDTDVDAPGAALGEPMTPEEFLRERTGTGEPSEPGRVTPPDDRDAPSTGGSSSPWSGPDVGIDGEHLEDAPPFESSDTPSPGPPAAPLDEAGGDAPAPHPLDDSRDVEHLRLDPAASRGWDADGQPGDDGLIAVVRMLDARGRPLRAAAPISLALLDPHPSLEGEQARLARWDFSAEEVAAAIQQQSGPDGQILLPVRWGERRPTHERLHLFARMTTVDERTIQTDAEVRIALTTGDSSHTRRAGWKPAPAPSEPAPRDRQPQQIARREQATAPTPTAPPSQPDPTPTSPSSDADQSGRRAAQPRPKLEAPVWSPDR